MLESELLTPDAVARIKRLEFFARTRVEGFLKGANRSRMKGISAEFMQHRMYMPGDDLRHLDWRVFARSDRLVTRVFEEFTNLDVVIALDTSASMGYGDAPMSKYDFAMHTAALFGYLLNTRCDRFALASCGETLHHFLPSGGGRTHLAEYFRQLVTTPASGEARLTACARLLLSRIRRRSVIVVLSDCYEEPAALTKALGQLRLKGHDVVLYQIVHESERDLDFTGFTLFRDMETGQLDGADPLEIREAYRDVVVQHEHALRTGAASFGIEFHTLTVTENWDALLAALLHQRELGR